MPDLNSIRAITFDVGGTLIQPWPSVGHVYAEVAARHGLNVSPELLNRNFAAAWRAKQDFNHTRSDWARLVAATFAEWREATLIQSFFDELYDRFASPKVWRLFEDVRPALEELRKRDLQLAIISNWDERLRLLLPGLNLEHHFASIIISCEVGASKPARAIFDRAVQKLGLSPDSVLHVGDSYEEDLLGARQAGLQAIWLDRKETGPQRPDTIATLRALPDLAQM